MSFDDGKEVGGVFLDISKAFKRVWHEGRIFKVKQSGISGDLLQILYCTENCGFGHIS